MSDSSSFTPLRRLCGLLLLALVALPVAGFAQSRSAASQFNSTTVNDQINLQVLDAVTNSVYASFTRSCVDNNGTSHPHGSTWTSSVCPLPLSGGQVTYICISGYTAMQSSTCY